MDRNKTRRNWNGFVFGNHRRWRRYGQHAIVMMLAVLAIMYFLMIRPENKKKKEAEQMRSAVKVGGDKITTIGGVVGVVCAVKDDKIVVETSADRVRVEFAKWAIFQRHRQRGRQGCRRRPQPPESGPRKKRRPQGLKSNPEMAVAGVSRGGNTGCCFHRMFAYI